MSTFFTTKEILNFKAFILAYMHRHPSFIYRDLITYINEM